MKKFLFIPILCMALILPAIKTLAADPNEVKTCNDCKAPLTWVSNPTQHYTTIHYLPTNLVDADKRPIYEKCTVEINITDVAKICPNGHGIQWRATCHQEYHSSTRCGDKIEYK